MEAVKAEKVKSFFFFFIPFAIFLGLFFAYGPGIYDDSDQYINMHIHREPLYPFFLWIVRKVVGANWLIAAGIIQCFMAAVTIWLFARYIAERFCLHTWEMGIVVLLEIFPYVASRFFSATKLIITNSILSEALCMPLFTLFIMGCFRMLAEEEEKRFSCKCLITLLLALLLSLTRNQMMMTFIAWMIVMVVRILKRSDKHGKRLLRIGVVFFVMIMTFLLRGTVIKCYNLAFNGYFIPNTYGSVNILTNIVYASDREDGENIEDEEARRFFYLIYDTMDAEEMNYKYAGDSIEQKVRHLEASHDGIKYNIIEPTFYQAYIAEYDNNYILINLQADKMATKIIKGILPKCFFTWFLNYLMLAIFGMIRSIAVDRSIITWLTFLIYGAAMILTIMTLRRNRKPQDAAWLMGLALLIILGNVATVSITIMPLSRYMVYGFAPFYIAGFLLVIEWYREIKE